MIGFWGSSELGFHCLMTYNYKLSFCFSKREKLKAVQKRRIKLIVEWDEVVHNKKDLSFCLHCGEIYSRTGFYYHSEILTLNDDDAQDLFTRWTHNMDWFTNLIKNQIERRFVEGKMRGRSSLREMDEITEFTVQFQPSTWRPLPRAVIPRRPILPRVDPINSPHPLPYQDQSEQDIVDELQDFSDILACLSNKGFDARRFSQFAEHFLREMEDRCETKDFISNEKAKIVSVLAKNLYVMCTLSKDQMKNLTAFWKAMIVFISPKSAPTTKKAT